MLEHDRPHNAVKRGCDIFLSGFWLVITLPKQFLTVGAVAAAHGRPIFHGQELPVKNGQPFRMVKFRSRLAGKLDSAGMRHFSAVHPSSTKGFGSVFGNGMVVCVGATISTHVKLDRHAHVNPDATIGDDSVLHEFVAVNPAAVTSGEVVLSEGALVGAAATILQGLSIGERSVVAAGAVVIKDVPPAVVATGDRDLGMTSVPNEHTVPGKDPQS